MRRFFSARRSAAQTLRGSSLNHLPASRSLNKDDAPVIFLFTSYREADSIEKTSYS
jgi:hypothetical protein